MALLHSKPACQRRAGNVSAPARSAPLRRCARLRVAASKVFIDPVKSECTAFAPATVANLGPGFDWMGCAVQVRGVRVRGGGDTVVAKVIPGRPGEIVIESIQGDGGRLSLDPAKNCIGVAAAETLKLVGAVSCGVSLTLDKGLPLGSGMGSSAASAAAAAWAVNGLFGSPVSKVRRLSVGGWGAYGCTISGAGPTAVAIVDDPVVGARVAEAMAAAFRSAGKLEVNTAQVVQLDQEGAKFV
ncbi:Homoserine kinase [Tetrabaena socialis]|uniref:Homoserine kinase n=1 Tax=Tetrabaena socialis TaxID=47790 RepID=A0A2J8A144_9CHLO|nr:Homoserine kinase [Tetrabaena socialis]|eukprot:PNH06234.1 Homoserine kinase [Tetrabaena socialis]